MKKLKLDFGDFHDAELLTKEQLKNILGGLLSGGGCTLSSCSSDSDCKGDYTCEQIPCTADDGSKHSYGFCELPKY
jgi:hypothetical protein